MYHVLTQVVCGMHVYLYLKRYIVMTIWESDIVWQEAMNGNINNISPVMATQSNDKKLIYLPFISSINILFQVFMKLSTDVSYYCKNL